MPTEKDLIRAFERAIRGEGGSETAPPWLKYMHTHLNLASTRFGEVWSNWYAGQPPPNLEVDLLCVFTDIQTRIDEVMLVAVEVKYFQPSSKRSFYHGFDQVLAFSLFGFDGLSLWHLFPSDVERSLIMGHASAAIEIVQHHNLPLFYLAAKVGDKLQLSSYSPAETTGGVDYYLQWMSNHIRDNRNPLLQSDEVRKRRRTLKAMLKIP